MRKFLLVFILCVTACVNDNINIEKSPLTVNVISPTIKRQSSYQTEEVLPKDIIEEAEEYLKTYYGFYTGRLKQPTKTLVGNWVVTWDELFWNNAPIYGSYLKVEMNSRLCLNSISVFPKEKPDKILQPKLSQTDIALIFKNLKITYREMGMIRLYYIYHQSTWKLAYLVHLGQRYRQDHQHCWIDADSGELIELDNLP